MGREAELAELRAALDDAKERRGRFFLIVGDAGIGKTRLVERIASDARGGGALLLRGRGGAGDDTPSYWPWRQALRGLVRDTTDPATDALRAMLSALPSRPGAGMSDVGGRTLFFDAVASLLAERATRSPVLLILEDVHDADPGSLDLLDYILGETADAGVLVMATAREGEGAESSALGRLATRGRRMRLGPLSVGEVGELVGSLTGAEAPPDLVTEVCRLTDGTPALVAEVAQLLASDGSLASFPAGQIPIPQQARTETRERLGAVGSDVVHVLELASVLGREFPPEALAYLAHRAQSEIDRCLRDATAAGLIAAAEGPQARRRFARALAREALYEDVPDDRRRAMHRRAFEVLEGLHGDDLVPHASRLAAHIRAAGGDLRRAADYAFLAARSAEEERAFDRAAQHYAGALDDLRSSGGDPEIIVDTLLALGDAQWRTGDLPGSRATLAEAVALARELDLPDRVARAALGLGAGRVEAGTVDEDLVQLLRRSAQELDPTEAPLRARVLGRLAVALYFSPGSSQTRNDLSREAVSLARAAGEPAGVAAALAARHFAIWAPDSLEERLELAETIVAEAEGVADPELELEGRVWRIVDLLESGDRRRAENDIRLFTRRSQDLGLSLYRWYAGMFATMLALLDARFDDAAELAPEAYEAGRRAGVGSAPDFFAVQLFVLRRERGGLEELAGPVEATGRRSPHIPSWTAAGALIAAETGQESVARARLAALAEGIADFPWDGNWLLTCALASHACALVADGDVAEVLYRALLPYEDRHAVVASAVAHFSPVALALGGLATVLDLHDDARRHLGRALDWSEAAGAAASRVRTLEALGRLELAAGDTTGRESGIRFLEGASRQALELGMETVEARIAPTLARLAAAARPVRVRRTFMFTDIARSTDLAALLGDEQWQSLLGWHDEMLRALIAEHGGEEANYTGDGFFVAFTEPDSAVRCAVAIQRRLEEHRRAHGFAPPVRIGLHLAEATHGGRTYHGVGVHQAERITATADAGQIVASGATADACGDPVDVGERRTITLRGVPAPIEVVTLRWR